MFKKNQFLVISVLVHLVVVYVLAQSIMFPSGSELVPEKPPVVQATLWFDTPPKLKEPEPKVNEPEQTPPLEPEVLEEQPEQSMELPSEPQVEPLPPEPLPAKPVKTEEMKPEPEPQAPATTRQPEPSKPSTQSGVTSPVTNMARRHLNSFHQQQQARLAEQASRDFRQQQNSPIIDAEVQDKFLTEDEKFRDTLKVKADCSSTSKKTAAVVLGFLGGNVECSDPPPIKGFIQKHINKTALQPESRADQRPKRPQSLVIDK